MLYIFIFKNVQFAMQLWSHWSIILYFSTSWAGRPCPIHLL